MTLPAEFRTHTSTIIIHLPKSPALHVNEVIAGSVESIYSLIWGSHKIWGKGGGDTLDLL